MRTDSSEDWVDLCRAFAIVLVVFGHVFRGLNAAHIVGGDAFFAIDTTIYTFHMPLFFIVSGYLFAQSIRRRPFLRSYRVRFLDVARPYVIWSAVMITVTFLAANAVNYPLSFDNAVEALVLIPIRPYQVFWYFYVVLAFQFLFAVPYEKKVVNAKALLLLALALHVGFLYLRRTDVEIDYFAVSNILENFIYLGFGAVVLAAPWAVRQRANPMVGLAGAVVFAAAVAWLIANRQPYESPVGSIAALSGSLTVIGLAVGLSHLAGGRMLAPLLTIGRNTLAIYCLHIFFGSGTRIFLLKAGLFAPSLHIVAGTCVGVAGPLTVLWMARRFGVAQWLGIDRISRSAVAAPAAGGRQPVSSG